MTKQRLKKPIKENRKQRTFKATDREIERMQNLANEFAGGNLSVWIRFACSNHRMPVGAEVPTY